MTWGQGAGWQATGWHAALWFGPATGTAPTPLPDRLGGGGGGGSGQLSLSEYLDRFGSRVDVAPASSPASSPAAAAADLDANTLIAAVWMEWFDA